MCGHTRGPVIYSKFHRNPFRVFGAPGGQNLAFPITLASRVYDSLYYRTSRDTSGPKIGESPHRYLWQNNPFAAYTAAETPHAFQGDG